MKYFTIKELTASPTAVKYKISNNVGGVELRNLMLLVDNCLDPIREKWGKPIKVNSGYRCPELNTRVGGSSTSAHMSGQAADITTGSIGTNRQLFGLIQDLRRDGVIDFDQLIWEHGGKWIHISYREGKNRQQIFTIG